MVKDLRIQVEEVRGFCDLPMRPGDYFELRGGRVFIPEGKYVCMWSLAAILPMLPAKQRALQGPDDWLPGVRHMVCPDPKGGVVWRISSLDEDPGQEASRPPRMLVEESVCSGCRTCELACSFAHSETFHPSISRIQVDKDEPTGLDRPNVCRQCGVAPCLKACPEDALARHGETRAVLVDESRCSGCGLCAGECPFSAIQIVDGRALICDLCGGEPACVRMCATGALKFGEGDSI